MADDEPQQTPTPAKTPKGKKQNRPAAPERTNSEVSTTEDDQGYESRSRSQSRRRRRQNQRQRQAQSKSQAGNASAQSMAAIDEDDEPQQQQLQRRNQQMQQQEQQQLPPRQYVDKENPQWLKNPQPQDITETQPFEYIKPPSQSMMGPVSYARMLRGEIPWVGPPPTQPLETAQAYDAKDSSGKDPMDQDGLKLRIELNLDIEIELKAHIHGDLTLALLA